MGARSRFRMHTRNQKKFMGLTDKPLTVFTPTLIPSLTLTHNSNPNPNPDSDPDPDPGAYLRLVLTLARNQKKVIN